MPTITNSSGAPAAVPGAMQGQSAIQKAEEPARVYYAEACEGRTPLSFHMRGGQHIAGIVRAYGTFPLDVETPAGRVLLYKHGLDMVEIANASTPRNARPGIASSTAAPSPLRPPVGGAR